LESGLTDARLVPVAPRRGVDRSIPLLSLPLNCSGFLEPARGKITLPIALAACWRHSVPMLRFWTTFRTALDLAAHVDQLERHIDGLERQILDLKSDWTDVLDKMSAREDRIRKRLQRGVVNALSEGEPSKASEGAEDPRSALRGRLALRVQEARERGNSR